MTSTRKKQTTKSRMRQAAPRDNPRTWASGAKQPCSSPAGRLAVSMAEQATKTANQFAQTMTEMFATTAGLMANAFDNMMPRIPAPRRREKK